MVAGVIAMVTNVAGNYLLITPQFGLPGFGVAGAAWASVIASWLGFAVIGAGFLGERYGEHAVTRAISDLTFAGLWRVLRFGFPNGINWFLEFAAFALFINIVVGHLGTTVLAAFNVVACAWMGSVALIYLSCSDLLMGWFRPEGVSGDALVEVGASMLALSSVWQLFDALGLTFGEALRAAGDTTFCMTLRVALAWMVFMPAAWFMVRVLNGGPPAVMLSLILYLVLIAAGLGARFASGKWRDIDLVGVEPAL